MKGKRIRLKPSQRVPDGKLRLRKNAALARLKISPEELRNAPPLSEILKEVRGGIGLAIKAMRFSDSEPIVTFLKKYDSISERDRKSLSFEAIALAARINVATLLGEILLAERKHSVMRVTHIAVSAHPDVMKSRARFALKRDGYRDRDKMDEILGALKPAAGSTFIGKAFFGSGKEEPEEEKPEPSVTDEDWIFPDCEVMQEHVQPMRQKLLETK